MTKEELEKATGQELIDERNYCGADGYYGDYLDDVNAEMLKRFNRLAELEKRCANYEMTISKMEKGTCDICKGTEKDNRIVELEEKISVLLSCKNCPENKGGLLCQKEYEDKCLTQKIQYIKELKEENENLKKTYRKQRNKRIDDLQKENAELKKQLEMSNKVYNDNLDYSHHIEGQLTKAKEIIKDYMIVAKGDHCTVCSVPEENRCINVLKLNEQAEQFLKDSEEEK